MKKIYLLLLSTAGIVQAQAQCLDISCNSNISVANDSGQCGAVVNFTAPSLVSYTCPGNISDTFNFTGAMQTFTVPAGVTSINIQTWGAQGGSNWASNTNFGGYVSGDVTVTPGSTLYIYVGGQATTTAGGFNGGGSGEGAGKGGGGGTDVRIGGMTYNDRVVVAGGGGGAGYWSSLHVVGGQGGGLVGTEGYRDPSFAANPGGKGGTQSAGGADGTCVNFNVVACAGGFGYGGSITGCGCEVYGGGGGWYGGAASGNCRGGGGGSGYAIPSASNVTMQTGVRAGNGMVVLTYSGGNVTVNQVAGLPSGSLFPIGTTVNTFIGDDGAGNADTCTFTVTVTDNEAPVITSWPSNVSTPALSGQCGGTMAWTAPTASDNCPVTITSSANSGDFFPVGTTPVTIIATDAAGNADTVIFTVTFVDTEPPTFTNVPADITQVNDSGMCGGVVTWTPPTGNDNCAGFTITSSSMPGDTFGGGQSFVFYYITDASGLSDTVSFQVTITDQESPTITCPQDITVPADSGMCSASVNLGTPVYADNCFASLTNDAPSSFPVGTTVVTWTATDPSFNTTTCQQTVTVTDNEPPVMMCPMDVMSCEGVVTFSTPPATDNCAGVSVTQVSGPASGSTLPAGLYTIVFVATDSAGNTDTCSFDLTVNANPVIVASNPNTVCVTDGAYTLSATPAGGTWSGTAVSGNTFAPATAGNGTHVLTYNVTNANGCSATAVDSIVVSPCVGINESGALTFTMFPNPATEGFTFTASENGVMEMYSADGKIVLAKQIVAGTTQVSTQELAGGTYMVRFVSSSGTVATGQLVLQR